MEAMSLVLIVQFPALTEGAFTRLSLALPAQESA